MSRQINQPINQVRLTNVATVRLTVKGQRFEIACYRNKVLDYRAGLETDLSEVLQTDRIFTNVSKGQFAAEKDLARAFGPAPAGMTATANHERIAQHILQQGQSLQVSDKERQVAAENTLTQTAVWISRHAVHSDTGRPYTVAQIKQALAQHNYATSAGAAGGSGGGSKKNKKKQQNNHLKKQYLEAIKFLKTVMPIERAKMELSLQFANDPQTVRQVQDTLNRLEIPETLQQIQSPSTTTSSTTTTTRTIVMQVDPSLYRPLNELAQTLPAGRLEIVQQQVMPDITTTDETKSPQQQQQPPPETTTTTTTAATTTTTTMDNYYDPDDEEAVALAQKLQAVRVQQQQQPTPVATTTTTNAADNDDKDDSDDDDDDDVARLVTAKKMGTDLGDDDNDDDESEDNSRGSDHDGNNNSHHSAVAVPHSSPPAATTSDHNNDQDNGSDDDDDKEEEDLVLQPALRGNRKQQRKAQKKKNKKAKRRQQQTKHQQQEAEKDMSAATAAAAEPANTKQPELTPDATATLAATATTTTTTTTTNANARACNTCGGAFYSAAEYRAHFRSDWHLFNQKLKLKGIPAVSHAEFAACDADSFFNTTTTTSAT